jgi:predicted DNA binding CopG/RHH family protein
MDRSDLDLSDIPESTNSELARARRVGRPKSGRGPKRLIAIRIDPTLLNKLRKMASNRHMPYQSFIHHLLEKAAKKAA